MLTSLPHTVTYGDAVWLDEALLAFRQYLVNYYHVLMDDAIALWWLARREVESSRDVPLIMLDNNDAG